MARFTSPAILLAALARHSVRLPDDRSLYALVARQGRFLAVALSEIFDAYGAPITLHAELALGSIVRVSLVAGHPHAIQVVHVRYADPFGASP